MFRRRCPLVNHYVEDEDLLGRGARGHLMLGGYRVSSA